MKKHGFFLVSEEEKNILLRKYWSIPDRQVETSVVLADTKFRYTKSQTIASNGSALDKELQPTFGD